MSDRAGLALLFAVLLALLASVFGCADPKVWLMETLPVPVGAGLIVATWHRFRLTSVLCWLLAAHAIILIVGGHYTYSHVPIGDWLRDVLGLQRNPYDRIGHFAQGFVPAILTREILLRTSPLRGGKWLFFLVTCVCLAFSAFYELVEWWTAIGSGDGSPEFIATQGDPWDAQWDMCIAMFAAMLAQVLLAGLHDRQLKELDGAVS